MKVLVELFQKLERVEGAKPSSPSADGEIPLKCVSFLIAFFFALISSKKKAADGFCGLTNCRYVTSCLCLLIKALVELFQKLARVEGAKPSSRSAEREIFFLRFFF